MLKPGYLAMVLRKRDAVKVWRNRRSPSHVEGVNPRLPIAKNKPPRAEVKAIQAEKSPCNSILPTL